MSFRNEPGRVCARLNGNCSTAGRGRSKLVVEASLCRGRDIALANHVAWDMAWLLVRAGRYTSAAEWFGRVDAPPLGESLLWPAAREAQVQICHTLARQSLDVHCG